MEQGGPLSVTLHEVLHLALPAGSGAISGEEQLERRVRWARLLRARPSDLSAVEPDELLILPAAQLEVLAEPRLLPRLLGELIEAGVAAFVVAGQPGRVVIAACAESGLPLLQVPSQSVLAEVERAVIGLILDRDAQLRRRAEEIYERLLATVLGNAGLPALVSALAMATGLEAAVFDDFATLQACSLDNDAFRHHLTVAASAILPKEAGGGLDHPGRSVTLRFEQEGVEWAGRLYPLQIGEAWAGHLGLIGRPGQAGELDRLLADRAATLVALELAKQRAVVEASRRWRSELLDELLDGNFSSEDSIVSRGQQLGHDLLVDHLPVVLEVDPKPASESVEDDQLNAARQRRRFPEVARSLLQRDEHDVLVAEREGVVLAFVPTATGLEPAVAVGLVERVRCDVQEALPGLRISAGVSRPVSGPRGFAVGRVEASDAVGIAQKLLGGGRTVHYGQVGIERLLFHLLGNRELERFALDVLGELLTYDAQHQGELVETLDVFLRCNGNHVRAARELHLHRNTLLYRLDRVREILSRDLEDAETRLALQVALRIRHVIAPRTIVQVGPSRRVARHRRSG